MLNHELIPDEGILLVTPAGSLESADFERLAGEVDPYIEERDRHAQWPDDLREVISGVG